MKRIAAAIICMAALAACNTVQGLGRDLQSGGRAVERGAEKVEEKLSE